MTDKWKCTTFVVECKKETMRWFDRWNLWALRRKIALQDHHYQVTNERLSLAIKENIENKKRINELESELRVKQKERDMFEECSKFNLTRNLQMRTEINTIAGLLQELSNDCQMTVK